MDFLSKYLIRQFYSIALVPNSALAKLAVDFPGWEGVQDAEIGAELAAAAESGEKAFNAVVELAYPGRLAPNGSTVALPEYDGQAISPSAAGTTLTSEQAKRFLDAGISGNISSLSVRYMEDARAYWIGVKSRNPGLAPAVVSHIDGLIADAFAHFEAARTIAAARL